MTQQLGQPQPQGHQPCSSRKPEGRTGEEGWCLVCAGSLRGSPLLDLLQSPCPEPSRALHRARHCPLTPCLVPFLSCVYLCLPNRCFWHLLSSPELVAVACWCPIICWSHRTCVLRPAGHCGPGVLEPVRSASFSRSRCTSAPLEPVVLPSDKLKTWTLMYSPRCGEVGLTSGPSISITSFPSLPPCLLST